MNPLRAAAEIGRFLEERGIPYMIIGGLALQHWGEPRLTRDVDLTILVDPDQMPELVQDILKAFSPRIPDAEAFALRHRVLLIQSSEGVPIDLAMGIPGYEEEALQRSVWIEFPEIGRLRMIAPEDLIIHKCVAGRPRDVEDVIGILIRQRLRVDISWIRRWLAAFREAVDSHDPLALFEEALSRAHRASEGEF